MIVITDGVSNTGKIDPITAADTADKFGIKIYTIGIGKDMQGEFETDFDSLQQIAEKTDGLFYRATDSNEFAEVLNKVEDTFLPAKTQRFITKIWTELVSANEAGSFGANKTGDRCAGSCRWR